MIVYFLVTNSKRSSVASEIPVQHTQRTSIVHVLPRFTWMRRWAKILMMKFSSFKILLVITDLHTLLLFH